LRFDTPEDFASNQSSSERGGSIQDTHMFSRHLTRHVVAAHPPVPASSNQARLSAQMPVRYVGDPRDPTTVPDILRSRAERTPDDKFITFNGHVRTYGEALAAAGRMADALHHLGVSQGTKVATLLPNSTDILDVWFGTALLGAVFVPINVGLKGDGLRYIVEHSEAAFIAVDVRLCETLEAAVPAGSAPYHRYVSGGGQIPDGYQPLRELTTGSYPPAPAVHIDPGGLASILYTSGTTGLPKGVMNCHNSFAVAAYEYTQRHVQIRQDDVLYTTLPLFHLNAQSLTTVGSLVSGRPMVLAPRFSASGFFDDIRAHGATIFNSIGAMLTMLFKQPERPDDANNPARLAVSAAAPPDLWRQFETRFGLTILEIYGLTETATFCLGAPPDEIKVGKIGKPVSWADVAIQNPDGTACADGESGEIVIRSKEPDTLFMGYYKNKDATSAAMAGGWFHSGDRGRRDPDGQFVFLDRLKDSIRRRGENISSYQIEQILNRHPLIAESAAVGVPSELGEEDVLVVIVPRGEQPHCSELIEYCQARMADFMVPRYVRFAVTLPRTATQRVEKYKLRDRGTAGAWDRNAVAARRS
jgi:carnitine-CoA ligase